MPIKEINKALRTNFKELDRAYLNTLESIDARLLAAYKTTLEKIGVEIQSVYAKFGTTPSITEVRKFNRLVVIEKQISDEIVELDRTVRNVISSQIKTAVIESYSSTVNGINQGFLFEFTSAELNKEGMKRFLTDTLWSDSMKNNSGDLLSKVKRDFETVLRANSREEIIAGVAEGKSYLSIMKDLQGRFEISANRAKTIAFTETHKAHSYGRNDGITKAMEAAKEFGIQANKVWRHNSVGKPRPDHVEADGTPANQDGMFNVGGEELAAPGLGSDPANNINCHCSAEFEVLDSSENVKAMEVLESKADVAREIFTESYGKEGSSRSDIIDRFVKEAGLTKAGASTYYQNLKKEFELGKTGRSAIKPPTIKPPVAPNVPVKVSTSGELSKLVPPELKIAKQGDYSTHGEYAKAQKRNYAEFVKAKKAYRIAVEDEERKLLGAKFRQQFLEGKFTESELKALVTDQDLENFAGQMRTEHNINITFKSNMKKMTRKDLIHLNKDIDQAFVEIKERSSVYAADARDINRELKVLMLENTDFVTYIGSDSSGITGYYTPSKSSIHLSTTIAKGAKLRSSYSDDLFIGGHNVGRSWKNLIKHEFGHHIEEYYMMKADSSGGDFFDLWERLQEVGIKKGVSTYASTNAGEFFAESFSAIMSPAYGKLNQRLPKMVEDWFVDVMKVKL